MRLQPLQAIVASDVLKRVNDSVSKRHEIASLYDKGLGALSDFIHLPIRVDGYKETFSLYMVKCNSRDDLLKYLVSKGVDAKVHYPVPLHLQNAAKALGYTRGDFPVAEDYANKIITLPAHQYLNDEQVSYVLDQINNFYIN